MPLTPALGAPAGLFLFIKVPSALEAAQHNQSGKNSQEINNRNIPPLVFTVIMTAPKLFDCGKGFVSGQLTRLMLAWTAQALTYLLALSFLRIIIII